MIQWRTGKPSGAIIVAKQTENFCGDKNYYEVLFWNERGYYYDVAGEEVPNSAIEKWAVIEELPLK